MPDLDPAVGAHFAAAIAAMRHPFIVFDRADRIVAFNDAFAALHCDDKGACGVRLGMSCAELTAWRTSNGFFDAMHAPGTLPAGYYEKQGEVIYRLKDGRWMLVERSQLPDGRGMGLWTDITAVKDVEAQLLRAQRISHIGSVERDFATGQCTYSEEVYRIFGVHRETFRVTDNEVLALVHPHDRARMEAVLKQTASDLSTKRHEFRIIRPDGAERILVRESEVEFDPSGKPVRRVGTIQDVTELRMRERLQHALQAALRAAKDQAEYAARALEIANQALERRVEERTQQLLAAQDELLKKERLSTIGQLTATVAHELRNPLSAIRNTIFGLKGLKAENPASLERMVARMERSIERCNQIIGELLDYSRARTLACEAQSIDSWLAEVLADQTLPPRVALVTDLQAGEATAYLDSDRFRRVLINLVDNAAQALKEAPDLAEPRIAVRTRVEAESIVIVVEDNGPGIPPDTLARIFEPLFSTKSFGTGLGLPVVKQIVEQHGGTIDIASASSEGTIARLCIPLHRKTAAA